MRIRDVNELPEQHRAQAKRQLADVPVLKALAPGCVVQLPAAPNIDLTPKRSKYRNVRVTLEGEKWDSKAEYEFFCNHLRPRKQAGEINLLLRQVTLVLEGGVRYRADFLAVTGPFELWDVKGFDTQASRNKRKQVLERYGAEVRLWKKPKKGKR